MDDTLGRLPKERLDALTETFRRFLRLEAMAGAVLLLCTVFALVLSNSPWSQFYLSLWETRAGFWVGNLEFSRSLKDWINDGLMTLFFFLIALELKREMAIGELRNMRVAALSLAGALGGMLVPVIIFLLLMRGSEEWHGWGTVMSTDTAFMIGCLAVLGARVPESLRLFLLSLAIFDDIGAILVIAFGYGHALNWVALVLSLLGVAVIVIVALLGIRSISIYFLMGGVVWLAFDTSGIHPTIAGVILGLLTPARSWIGDARLHAILARVIAYPQGEHWSGDTSDRRDLRHANIATREALSPIERLEIALHPWVAFVIVPAFALANAGVSFLTVPFDITLTIAVLAGFVIGKPIGVLLFSYLAVKLHWAILPRELTWRSVFFGATLTGIGFTMALLIAESAFDSDRLNSVKLGILLASIASATFGLSALRFLTPSKGP